MDLNFLIYIVASHDSSHVFFRRYHYVYEVEKQPLYLIMKNIGHLNQALTFVVNACLNSYIVSFRVYVTRKVLF